MTRPRLIENFLRPPRGPADIAADAVRAVGLVSVAVAAIWWQPTDAGILALALPALLVPRFIALRAGPDIVYGIVVLVAAWSNVVDLYRTVPSWDIVMHLVCTAVISAVAYVGLAQVAVVPAPDSPGFRSRTAVVLTTALGLAASAVWEMIEWFGKNVVSDAIFVGYDDTIGDMAVGGLGALLAGVVVARMPLLRSDRGRSVPRRGDRAGTERVEPDRAGPDGVRPDEVRPDQ